VRFLELAFCRVVFHHDEEVKAVSEKALLLVDDEAAILKALQRELGQWARSRGLRILTAGSAAEAERIVAQEAGAVCLLVSDVRMPGRSGPDLLQSVRAAWPDIIALLLTGFAELPELIKAVGAGAFSYILKPWDPDYLKAELEKALAVFLLRDQERGHTRRIEEDLRWAGELQTALFCAPLPNDGLVEFGSVYRPLSEFKCSGDYLDVAAYGENLYTMLVGDVAGHGVRAALIASFLKALVGAALIDPPMKKGIVRLDDLLGSLNNRICGSLPETLGMMITLGAAAVDASRGELAVASAGHPPLILLRDGSAHALRVEGLPLGAQPGSRYAMRRFRLSDGDVLVLHTDGLLERKGEAIGVGEQRLAAALEKDGSKGGLAERLVAAMTPDEGYADDVTVVTAAVSLAALPGHSLEPLSEIG
jgi:sigma-B regulation protein RsbU (phosphoserine phosphatase)